MPVLDEATYWFLNWVGSQRACERKISGMGNDCFAALLYVSLFMWHLPMRRLVARKFKQILKLIAVHGEQWYCAAYHIARKSRPVVVGDPSRGLYRWFKSDCCSIYADEPLGYWSLIEQITHLQMWASQIVRITAQTRKYVANLEHIVSGIRSQGSNVPIVADIHFKPDAAMEAVKWCEMVN